MLNNQKEIILLKDLGFKYLNSIRKDTGKQDRKSYALYRCYCGNEFEAFKSSVKSGNTKSCGCTKITHNLRSHRLYSIWYDMVRRCTNPKRKDYVHYGARGIKVCDEWLDINNFIKDMYPSFIDGLELDRIDVNGNYCKDNCRWTTRTIQTRNTKLLRKDNKTGYRGVYWYKITNKWRASIRVDKKHINLGYYKDKLEAAKAYDKYVIDNNLEHTRNF